MTTRTRAFTGRERHRLLTRCFRKPLLVLQREWRYTGIEVDLHGACPYDRPYDFCVWEDAQTHDDLGA